MLQLLMLLHANWTELSIFVIAVLKVISDDAHTLRACMATWGSVIVVFMHVTATDFGGHNEVPPVTVSH